MTRRKLPTSNKFALLINGKWGLIALALFIFQFLISNHFFSTFDPYAFIYLRGELKTGKGKVVDVFETSLTVNDIPMYGYDYVFYAPDGDYYWTSYKRGDQYDIGDDVKVEYNPDKPYIHRIKGMSNTLGGGMFLLPLFASFVWISYNFISGLKKMKIINNGELAKGKLVDKEPTLMQVNDQAVYNVIFSFETKEGLTYEASTKTHQSEDVGGRLIYDKDNPDKALLLDSLPWNTGEVIQERWSE
ncbi:MAG: DUF3592 domain-containing protein [Cytophagales bacterium]|nr:DUF3592 domain-containing protein [Cytophagales bacterium]